MKTGGLTFIRIIIAVLAIFALVVIGYQLYKYNFLSIKTESAVMGEIYLVFVRCKGVCEGILFRSLAEPVPRFQIVADSGAVITDADLGKTEGQRLSCRTFYAESPVKPVLCGVSQLIVQMDFGAFGADDADISACEILMDQHSIPPRMYFAIIITVFGVNVNSFLQLCIANLIPV